MKSFIFIGILAALSACSSNKATDTELIEYRDKIVGVWIAESVDGRPISGECLDMYMEYKVDGTVESHSGRNISYQTYEILRKENRWITRAKVVSSNNEPNCQGYTMDQMDSNDVADLVTDIVGGRMLWFASTKDTEPFATLVKGTKP